MTERFKYAIIPTEELYVDPAYIGGEYLLQCKDCYWWVSPNTCGYDTITRYEDDFCSRGEWRKDKNDLS